MGRSKLPGHPGHFETQRVIRQRLMAEERERRALELYIQGVPQKDIAVAVHCSPSHVSRLLNRGLERRAAEEGPTVEAARALYRARLEHMLSALLPSATGRSQTITEDGLEVVGEPDVRAAEVALKVIDKLAAIDGATRALEKTPDTTVSVYVGGDSDVARVMAELEQVAQHRRALEATIASQGSDLNTITGQVVEDRMPPPPIHQEG